VLKRAAPFKDFTGLTGFLNTIERFYRVNRFFSKV